VKVHEQSKTLQEKKAQFFPSQFTTRQKLENPERQKIKMNSSAKRQKGLTTNALSIQLDPFAF